ncbi:MAG: hypothetical protein U5N85_13730 [Arcicella sp.]|nr:hypothetical protein [Arcicella sp.]
MISLRYFPKVLFTFGKFSPYNFPKVKIPEWMMFGKFTLNHFQRLRLYSPRDFLLRESRISWISSKFSAKNIIREFLVYAKRPTYILEESVITQKEKIFYIKQLLKFEACVAFILFPLIFLTKELTNAEYSGFKEDNWKAYFIVVLVAPILEEIILSPKI